MVKMCKKQKSPRPAGTKGFRGATLIVRTGDRPWGRPVSFGGAEGTRTLDPHNAIVVLSQLSYSPEVCSDLSIAITGEPGADYGPNGLSPALLPGEFGLVRARRPQCRAFTIPDSLSGGPTTPVRSIYLLGCQSVARVARLGGAEGIRTPDLYSAIVALSQLSYSPGK